MTPVLRYLKNSYHKKNKHRYLVWTGIPPSTNDDVVSVTHSTLGRFCRLCWSPIQTQRWPSSPARLPRLWSCVRSQWTPGRSAGRRSVNEHIIIIIIIRVSSERVWAQIVLIERDVPAAARRWPTLLCVDLYTLQTAPHHLIPWSRTQQITATSLIEQNSGPSAFWESERVLTLHWMWILFSSFHISVCRDCPGYTGFTKRTWNTDRGY